MSEYESLRKAILDRKKELEKRKCDGCENIGGPFTIFLEGMFGYHFCPECSKRAGELRKIQYEKSKKWYWRLYWKISGKIRRVYRRIRFKVRYRFL